MAQKSIRQLKSSEMVTDTSSGSFKNAKTTWVINKK